MRVTPMITSARSQSQDQTGVGSITGETPVPREDADARPAFRGMGVPPTMEPITSKPRAKVVLVRRMLTSG